MRRHPLLLGLALVLGAVPSPADQTPSLALAPAPAGDPLLLTELAQVRGDAHLRARVLGVFAREPLVLQNDDQEYDRVVESQLWLHALASLSLSHRYQLSVDVPVLVSQATGEPPSQGATASRPLDETLLGDLRLGARIKLLGPAGDGEHLALSAGAWLPTGKDYAGDDGAAARGAVVVDGTYPRWLWAAELGGRTRSSMRLPGVVPTRVGSAVTAAVGQSTFLDAARQIAVSSELVGAFTVAAGAKPFDPRGTRVHVLLGARYRPIPELELGGGFGPDLGQAPGAADFRALGFVGFSPEVAPPPPDRDEDRVPDRLDACVDLPGVASSDPEMNGCPEVPPDFDTDEIPDQFDACPKEAGIATGDRRTHGCPKRVDTDGDKIVDRDDACPREKGAPSADRAKNGCPPPPPPPPPAARVEDQQVAISEQVQFEHGTAVLRPESDGILAEVAKVLATHPELELIEVAGHTDDTGTPAVNDKLSQERAAAVVKWLVDRGTAAARLSAKGYGQSAPIADNTSDEGRAKNRRVEFRIVKRAEVTP
ncbi:MAG: OmpA family protein [Myxococcales bacterium]|nr:OmpA family protein [Myxococcales bacterium]